MIRSKVINFGVMAAWAASYGYSVPYYKRVFASTLQNIGRLKNTQGKPALRASDTFVIGAKNYAKSLPVEITEFFGETEGAQKQRRFLLGQDGLLATTAGDGDYVEFAISGAHIYARSCRLASRAYLIEGAAMIDLGGYYAE